jgi:hypothetical protein
MVGDTIMFAFLVITCGIGVVVAFIGILCYLPLNTRDWSMHDDSRHDDR